LAKADFCVRFGIVAGGGAGEIGFCFSEELVEERGAAAAGCLVGGGDDPFDAVEAVEWEEGHEEDGGGAVGGGDEGVMGLECVGVDFRNDEGNGWVEAKGRAEVDDFAAAARDPFA